MKVIKRVQVNALGIINMQYAIQFEHPKRLSNNGSCWTGNFIKKHGKSWYEPYYD